MKSARSVRAVASRTREGMVRRWILRPWWRERAQKEQSPKQPRWLVRLKRTSSSAGTPPDSRYRGWASPVKGSSYTRSSSSGDRGGAGGFCTTHQLPWSWARGRPRKGSCSSQVPRKASQKASGSSRTCWKEGSTRDWGGIRSPLVR